MIDAVTRELEAAGQLETMAGQQALVLAHHMSLPDAARVAGLSTELSRVMALTRGGRR